MCYRRVAREPLVECDLLDGDDDETGALVVDHGLGCTDVPALVFDETHQIKGPSLPSAQGVAPEASRKYTRCRRVARRAKTCAHAHNKSVASSG